MCSSDLAVKEFNQLSADQAVSMQDDSSDSGEAVTPLVSSTSEEKSDELPPKMNNDLGLVRRSRRSVNSIPSQVVPSNASSLLIDTSLEFESVEISNATTMSSTSRISRHLKLGAGAGRRRADRERGKLIDPAKLRQKLGKANARRIADKERREKLRSKLSAARNYTANLEIGRASCRERV